MVTLHLAAIYSGDDKALTDATPKGTVWGVPSDHGIPGAYRPGHRPTERHLVRCLLDH
jgi:hypothetical protein